MNIVFLERDTLGSDVSLAQFEEFGDVTYYPLSDSENNAKRAKNADIVILNKIPVDASLLDGNDRTKLVCLTATGMNNVDFDYVQKRGITVMNVAGYSTYSVAQHTFALLFYVMGKLKAYDEYVKSGKYMNSATFSYFYYPFNELLGKKWGIIGLGAIGERVAKIAQAFGCEVMYYSTSGKNLREEYNPVSLEVLLKEADIISIHCPLTDKTKGMIDDNALSMVKPTAYILNLARGAVIDEEALAKAIEEDRIAGAGLDVLCAEPMSEANPLLRVLDDERLFITPHIGWGTFEARQRCADCVADNIRKYLK